MQRVNIGLQILSPISKKVVNSSSPAAKRTNRGAPPIPARVIAPGGAPRLGSCPCAGSCLLLRDHLSAPLVNLGIALRTCSATPQRLPDILWLSYPRERCVASRTGNRMDVNSLSVLCNRAMDYEHHPDS
jgi:hypothetical protein